MRVVLGVCGGIAAYKACSVLRRLTETGHDVTVVPTESALRFVGEPTWAALSGKPVHSGVWSDVHEVPHVQIGQHADLVLVVPATANLLARAAHGLADDLLTNTLLTARCPVVLAPAMHTEMWEHPATRANVDTLRARGVHVIEPASGRLTGADTGKGRLPEPDDIVDEALQVLAGTAGTDARPDRSADGTLAPEAGSAASGESAKTQQLHGCTVIVSAGGTREPLDPVRFIGNRSSGKQGYALAAELAARGADVTLVAANVALPDPAGVHVVTVETTAQLQQAVTERAAAADAVIMAAAPADYRPARTSESKIKKDPAAHGDTMTLELVENPDIVKGLVADRTERGATRPVIVSFAAETGDASHSVLELARAKLARKGSDLQVVNEVGVDKTFGLDTTTVHLMRQGEGVDGERTVGPATKAQVSVAIVDELADLLGR